MSTPELPRGPGFENMVEQGLIDPGWAEVLQPEADRIAQLGDFLRAEISAGRGYLPAGTDVFRAFVRPFDAVRVLIVGQDPYPTPGHPIGLSFATARGVRPLPRSLANIYRELHDDVGITPPAHGDLGRWADQGVMLLNRVLTVQPGVAGAHRGRGWEQITELAVRALVARPSPLVAVLWGRDAATLAPILGSTPVVRSAHPSPLSASRGFFGSKPFSRVDQLLHGLGVGPVDWSIDD